MYTQTWTIENETFPPATCGLDYSHATPHGPYQLAYLCPFCGRVWARRAVRPATQWMALRRSCAKCPGELFIRPGSIMQSWDHNFAENLPREVLEYELLTGAKE